MGWSRKVNPVSLNAFCQADQVIGIFGNDYSHG